MPGEACYFVPGKINHTGNLTQILADELRIRLFTGYFFISVPVRVSWMDGKLALAQHCFYQTGHGVAEGGCEMPIEGVERHPGEQELTFVRMFSESNGSKSERRRMLWSRKTPGSKSSPERSW